jgi:2-C-methyl-D-erythritol 2,4-cyclodiphosphate synthase
VSEAREAGASLRVGHGFDAHRLVPGRPLMLGGVEVPHAKGLLGHSDGDCVLHAVCDAILGAAAAGDMGEHFPSRDERWKGAASRRFVEETVRLVAARGYLVSNLDVTVVAQEPVLAPHLGRMRERLAALLGRPESDVSIKAKSTDALGAVGRGEGVAAFAVVLLRRSTVP